MKENANSKKSIEEQKFEIELKKIKLNLEHGAEFLEMPVNIPLQVEREFLDYVERFEEEYSKCKRVQVYEFIGKPEFRKLSSIAQEHISIELELVLDLLADSNIHVDTLCEVDDREMYRFITEELFFEEMDDIRLEGMMHGFIYEEFHPNNDYDIRKSCTELVEMLFNKEGEFNPKFLALAEVIETKDELMKEQDFIKRLINFRESFSFMTLNDFEIISVVIGDLRADARFSISYSLTIDGSIERIEHYGEGNFGLVFDYGFWNISNADLPGISLS